MPRLHLAYSNFVKLIVVVVRKAKADCTRVAGRQGTARFAITRGLIWTRRLVHLRAPRSELALWHQLPGCFDQEHQDADDWPEDDDGHPYGLHLDQSDPHSGPRRLIDRYVMR